jgi:hypothetical protein
MYWIPLIAIVGSFVMVIVVVLSLAATSRRRAELRADVQTKLIDKFGSAPELVAFLESPAGQQFVDRVQGAPAVATRDKVISGVRKAVVIGAVGIGFLAIWIADRNRGFMYPGFLLLALGAGQIAAAFTASRLADRMDRDGRREVRATSL